MLPTTLFGFAVVPLLIALVQLLKETGVPAKYAPLTAALSGIAAGFAIEYGTSIPHPAWIQAVVYGLAYGLAASGTYSAVQKFTESAPASKP